MPSEGSTGQLTSRPEGGANRPSVPAGAHPLGLGQERDGLIQVPAGYDPTRPAPLLVLLHGAGGHAARMLDRAAEPLAESGVLVLVPESRERTWDVILGGYGPDVLFLDRALAATFDRYAVDPARVAIGGFSDGASYALSLGIMNGQLFTHILAFSPGFMAPLDEEGRPRIFMSHGTSDDVLPIHACSRRLAPILQQAGYELRYVEFPGAHAMPGPVVREALAWFLA